jgi:hypothetical protein
VFGADGSRQENSTTALEEGTMKTTKSNARIKTLVVCLLAANTWWAQADSRETRKEEQRHEPVRFAVIADPHLYQSRLGTTGQAFEAYVAQDPKLLAQSEAILEAALEDIIRQHVRFLIIPGDLTKDGELVDHMLMARHLAKLERRGIQVFVIPGNHDINNPDAVAYPGDTTEPVRNVSPEFFRAIYQPFGYGQAIDRDEHSLSYVAEPVHGLWLLGIDSCKYDQNAQLGTPVVSGQIKPETMDWVARKLAEAKTHRKHVIAFMHHGVNQHFLGEAQIFPEFLVDNWPSVSQQLAELGLNTVFTGHYHSQDAAFPLDAAGVPQATLCDVETGSLVMYPCAYRIVSIGIGGTLDIQSERVTEIKADTDGMPFQDYAHTFLAARLPNLVTYQLMSLFRLPQDQAAQVAPLVAEALIANYAGDEAPSAQTQALIGGLVGSSEPLHTLGLMLGGLWTDLPPKDNQLEWPLD